MPAGATPEFSTKNFAEDSLSCSEVTGDYTLDAMSRSTEILFNGDMLLAVLSTIQLYDWLRVSLPFPIYSSVILPVPFGKNFFDLAFLFLQSAPIPRKGKRSSLNLGDDTNFFAQFECAPLSSIIRRGV